MLALCVLDTEDYKYTFIILNVYDFSTATVVMRMHLSVMCIHMLSVLLYVSGSYTGQWLIVMLLSYYTLHSDEEKNV